MAKKKAGKAQLPVLLLQPHRLTTTADVGPDRSAWLSQLKASLHSVHSQRITYLALGAELPNDSPASWPIPRYTLIVVDHSPPNPPTPPSCGVLIIAQGRELEFLFSQRDGQLLLARQHSFHRLILVRLNRTHRFTSLAAVQDELRPFIPPLLPSSTPPSSVPFLALSPDLGDRREVHTLSSPLTGDVVVEDILQAQQWTRRLLFASTGCVQSEARLLRPPAEGGGEPAIDVGWLACAYQRAFIAALSLLPHPPTSILLIGLGAGSLPSLLSLAFPRACITVVELDPSIAQLAAAHFSFTPHPPHTTLLIDDGLSFLASTTHTYDLLVVDCNASDLSSGISFPSPAFLHPPLLHRIHSLTRTPGLFLLNFGCRSPARRAEVLWLFTDVWGDEREGGEGGGGGGGDGVYEVDVDEEDVNTVLVGRRGGGGGEEGGEMGEEGGVTKAVCRRRVLSKARVEEERRKAMEEGVQVKEVEWRWDDEEWGLRAMVDAFHVIEREQGGEGQAVKKPLAEGTVEEGEEGGGGEDGVRHDGEGTGLSAEERKRAKARAKRARQKLKKRGVGRAEDDGAVY